jgi:hypothetical protein
MEDFVDNLPLPVCFQQREQVREAVAGPVVEFQPHGSDRADQVDAGNPCLKTRCRTVLVVPSKNMRLANDSRSRPNSKIHSVHNPATRSCRSPTA